jgi:heme/copper-type cytochrome/quinol oxidase subunit 4
VRIKRIHLTHNGIDIDQYILLTLYPTIIIFGLGFAGKKKKLRQSSTYLLQALTCIIFSIAYFLLVPNGAAQGLAIVLALFGILLLFVARKYTIHPESEQESHTAANSGL